MLLDLSNTPMKEPTERMQYVLYNIERFLGIDIQEALLDRDVASILIDKYQEVMHNKVSAISSSNSIRPRRSYAPRDGKRKYYTDGICKYSAYHGKYVEEADYDRTIRQYGSYENKARVEELGAQVRRHKDIDWISY